jgi:hypothetical protein
MNSTRVTAAAEVTFAVRVVVRFALVGVAANAIVGAAGAGGKAG